MKKIITALCFAITVISAAFMFGCNEKKTANDKNLVYGFESYTELYSLTPTRYAGRATLNTDKKYVSQGDASFYWEIDSPYYGRGNTMTQGTDAIPKMSIYDMNFYSEITDKTDVACYSVDVYNANDYNVKFMLYVACGNKIITSKISDAENGRWTTVYAKVNPLIAKDYDAVTAIHMGVYMDNPVDMSVRDAKCKLYLDNLIIYKGENVLHEADAESAGMINNLSETGVLNYIAPVTLTPPSILNLLPVTDVSFNYNPLYAKDAEGSIRLDVIPMIDGTHLISNDYIGDKGRVGFRFLKEFAEKIDLKLLHYRNEESLQIDVFNAGNAGRFIYLTIEDVSGETATDRAWIEKGEWGTVKLSDYGKADLGNITVVKVTTDIYSVSEPVTLYFNNLRTGV